MSWIVPIVVVFLLAFVTIWGVCEWLSRRLAERSARRRNGAGFPSMATSAIAEQAYRETGSRIRRTSPKAASPRALPPGVLAEGSQAAVAIGPMARGAGAHTAGVIRVTNEEIESDAHVPPALVLKRLPLTAAAIAGTLAVAGPAAAQFGGPPGPPNTGVPVFARLTGGNALGQFTGIVDPPKGQFCYILNVSGICACDRGARPHRRPGRERRSGDHARGPARRRPAAALADRPPISPRSCSPTRAATTSTSTTPRSPTG